MDKQARIKYHADIIANSIFIMLDSTDTHKIDQAHERLESAKYFAEQDGLLDEAETMAKGTLNKFYAIFKGPAPQLPKEVSL